MCGLAGMIGPDFCKDDLHFIKELGYISALRGFDGTGVLQGGIHKKTSTCRVDKAPVPFSRFLTYHHTDAKGNNFVLDSLHDNFMAIHVRAATIGKIEYKNTHPFAVGDIIGMHNGTLKDHKYFHEELTDSEMMFKDISKRGVFEVLPELNEGSAYAIVMYDRVKKSFTIVRNHLRPLYVAVNKKRRVLYWASESEMLELAAKRNFIEFAKIGYFTPGLVHEFTPRDIIAGDFPDWKTTKLEEKKKPYFSASFRGYEGFDQDSLSSEIEKEIKEEAEKIKKEEKVTKPKVTAKSHLKLVHSNNPKKLYLKPCLYCHKDLTPIEQYVGKHIKDDKYICISCDEVILNVNQGKSGEVLLN